MSFIELFLFSFFFCFAYILYNKVYRKDVFEEVLKIMF